MARLCGGVSKNRFVALEKGGWVLRLLDSQVCYVSFGRVGKKVCFCGILTLKRGWSLLFKYYVESAVLFEPQWFLLLVGENPRCPQGETPCPMVLMTVPPVLEVRCFPIVVDSGVCSCAPRARVGKMTWFPPD